MEACFKPKNEMGERKQNRSERRMPQKRTVREKNLSVKVSMARELSNQGLAEEAVKRVLHLNKIQSW